MEDIRIDVGVYTTLEIDLTEFDFTGIDKVIMCVKNYLSPDVLFEHEFLSAGVYQIDITPDQSKQLRKDAQYDFDISVGDKRYKNGDNGKIILRKGCGECSGSQ